MSLITTELAVETVSPKVYRATWKVVKRKDSARLTDSQMAAILDQRVRESEGHWVSNEEAKKRLGI